MLIKISKFLLSIFIIYYMWFKELFGDYPIVLYGTVVIATLFILLDLLPSKRIPMHRFLSMLLGFGFYSLVTGIFVSSDTKWFLSILVTYFAYVIVCVDCYYIFYKTKEREWFLNSILVASILSAVQTVFNGVDYQTEFIVTTMSETNNPNFLGLTLVLGVFALIAKKCYAKTNFFLIMPLILFFLYAITLCGSKKSLICGVLLFITWLIPIINTEKGLTLRKVSIILGIIATIVISAYYLTEVFVNTSIYSRFLLAENASNLRMQLYKEAFEFWWDNPIIGIGFGQFQIHSVYHYYSHSIYSEVLSCTGLVGAIIFFQPFYRLVFILRKKIECESKLYQYDYTICFSMLIIELFLGLGQIYIYDFSHLAILLYLFTSCEYVKLENDKLLASGNYFKGRFSFIKFLSLKNIRT